MNLQGLFSFKPPHLLYERVNATISGVVYYLMLILQQTAHRSLLVWAPLLGSTDEHIKIVHRPSIPSLIFYYQKV